MAIYYKKYLTHPNVFYVPTQVLSVKEQQEGGLTDDRHRCRVFEVGVFAQGVCMATATSSSSIKVAQKAAALAVKLPLPIYLSSFKDPFHIHKNLTFDLIYLYVFVKGIDLYLRECHYQLLDTDTPSLSTWSELKQWKQQHKLAKS